MNKKGTAEFLVGVVFCIMICAMVIHMSDTKTLTPEEIEENNRLSAIRGRERFMKWHKNELKFCRSQGFELNDTYSINDCKILECFNESGMATYQFCNQKDRDGSFGGGLLVGWLLFS